MAEERSAEALEGRADTAALDFQAGIGTFYIKIKIRNDLVVAGMTGVGLLTVGAFYIANPGAVAFAVETALATWMYYVLSIRPSSILVEFVCETKERYEAFKSALAAGTVKQRLQEEFSKIGFEGDLEVTIVADDNAPQPRERNLAMSEAAAQTGFPEGSLSNPPEVDVALLKPLDLPKRFVEWKDVHLPIDILLLTMKECEFFSCLSYLNPDYYRSLNRKVGYVYLGEMGDGEEKLKVAVILCHGGFEIAGGGTTVTMVVFEALCALRPKAVICVGYCAGLKEKNVKLGDVIISSKLATYATTKVTAGNMIERGVRVLGSPLLSGILKSADHGWKAPLKNPNDLEVEVHKDGLLLSGPEVVSSDKSRMELIKRYPDAIGVEMEGEGLYPFVLDLPTEWVVIKGVSHYAGDNNSESDPWRQFSSLMAASLVAHIFSNAKVFQKWPHYKKPGI